MYDSIKRRRGEISETQEDTEEDEEEQDGTNIWYFTKKIEPYFLFDLEPINAFHENMHPQIFLGKKLFSKPLTESMRMISEML